MSEVSSTSTLMLTLMPAIIGLVGVLVGAAITVAKDVILAWAERQRNGVHAAIRIIGTLDQYAQKCIDVVYDNGVPDGPDHLDVLTPDICTPDAPSYPDHIDWKSLPKALAYRALTLPNAARDTDRHIGFSTEHTSPPDYEEVFEARQEGYARLGLEAMELASALRTEFHLPPKDRSVWNAEWDPEAFLRERLDKAKRGVA